MIFDVLFYIIYFLLAMGVGSLFMCGWYAITRGEIIYNTDGSERKVGKIFKSWHFFWTLQRRTGRMCVQGKALQELFIKINEIEKLKDVHFEIAYIADRICFDGMTTENMEALSDLIEWKTEAIPVVEKGAIKFYRNETEYIFPEWLRSPLSECVYCYASIYGSILYWMIFSMPVFDLYSWTEHPVTAKIFFWILYCISSSALNGALIKKVL